MNKTRSINDDARREETRREDGKSLNRPRPFIRISVFLASSLSLLLLSCSYFAGLTSAAGTFTSTGSMFIERYGHTATPLNDGTVLITGGISNAGSTLASAEIYNPTTGAFSLTSGSMHAPRVSHRATLLADGTVLISGGNSGPDALASTEIYNPTTQMFTSVGDMSVPRYDHGATVLTNGAVLITGGAYNIGSISGYGRRTAEIYNPATGTFSPTNEMTVKRDLHTATLLTDGTVLIAGGANEDTGTLATAEIYNPISGTFSATTGIMNAVHQQHTATLLAGGTVLITGGTNENNSAVLASAEIYDPITQMFTRISDMNAARAYHTATPLTDGTVLLVGGVSGANNVFLKSAEFYAPSTQTFTPLGDMSVARGYHTATLLTNGTVLITGGGNGYVVWASAELFAPTLRDTTPPTTTANLSPAPNIYGWNNTDVTVALNALDNPGGSGVKQITYSVAGAVSIPSTTVAGSVVSVPLTAEGTSTLTFFAADNAGNIEAARRLTVQIDKTPPVATASVAPAPNGSGWNNTNVTVSFTGIDNLSGIDSCSTPMTFMNEGAGQAAIGTCTDKAGNVSAPATAKVNIDKTPPVTTATPSPGALPIGVPLLTVSAIGTVKSTTGTTLGTVAVQCFDTVGLVVQLNAVDNAGGSGVATLTYAATGSKPITATTVNGMSAQTTITASGLTTLTFAATDMAGNPEGTTSESVIIGFGEDRVGFGCAMPTPNFTPPTHGTLVIKGTVTVNGVSYPFSKTITF